MKYLAIVDDNFISNFRVDTAKESSNIILVVRDKNMYLRGIELIPFSELYKLKEK